jgi:hypothetical protein
MEVMTQHEWFDKDVQCVRWWKGRRNELEIVLKKGIASFLISKGDVIALAREFGLVAKEEIKPFEITLTEAQAELVLPHIRNTERVYDKTDELGAVFCQAFIDDLRDGPIRVVGRYISHESAKKISTVLEEEK